MRNAITLLPALIMIAMSADCAIASGKNVIIVKSEWVGIFDQCMEGFKMECARATRTVEVGDRLPEDAVEKVKELYPDVVLTLGDDALEKVSSLKTIPIIYVLAKKTAGMTQPNITGVESEVGPDTQLSIIRSIAPEIKKIGFVYSDNSQRFVAGLEKFAPEHGFELAGQKVETDLDAVRHFDRLPTGTDAFMMLLDLEIYSRWKTVRRLFRRVAVRRRIPVISFTDSYMRSGVAFSICPDVCFAGRQAGRMAEKILAGADVKEMPPQFTEKASVIVNFSVARKTNLELTMDNLPAYRDFNRGKPKLVGKDAVCEEDEKNFGKGAKE